MPDDEKSVGHSLLDLLTSVEHFLELEALLKCDPWDFFRFSSYGEYGPDFGPDVAVIPLSKSRKGGPEYFAIIDKQDEEFVTQFNWSANIQEDRKTGKIQKIYVVRTIDGKSQYLHRLLTGQKNGAVVDHVRGCTLDNRDSQLRVTTHGANLVTPVAPLAASGERGVWVHINGTFRSGVKVRFVHCLLKNGKKIKRMMEKQIRSRAGLTREEAREWHRNRVEHARAAMKKLGIRTFWIAGEKYGGNQKKPKLQSKPHSVHREEAAAEIPF